MAKLSRQQVDCFDMFEKGVSISYDSAIKLQSAFADGVINQSELNEVKKLEQEGDKHVHECLQIINDAFITPIDRTDIVEILNGIESITDSVDSVADHIYMMRIDRSNDYLCKFVELVVVSCEKLHDLMGSLKKYRKDREQLMGFIIEVNRLEEVGDKAYSDSMRNLFAPETDIITIIKHKELYQLFETTLNLCEDVANMVDKIMIANS